MAKKASPSASRPTARKKTAKKAVPNQHSGAAAVDAPGQHGVRVRMYRQGLGDCILLSFNAGARNGGVHVLLDCGTLGNATTGVTVADALADVRQATGGKLDLLITTHEHKDHVSGFGSQRALFASKQIRVDRVWQAWTENPADPDAQRIAKYKNDLGAALTAMLASPGAIEAQPAVASLLEFFGPSPGLGVFAETVHATMEFVRSDLTKDVSYLAPPAKPTKPLEPDWLPGWRVYVLGPPRDATALGDTGANGGQELYGLAAAGRLSAATARAAAAADPGDASSSPGDDDQMPFDARFRRPAATATTQFPDYFDGDNAWRTIDNDYLRPTSELALQLDSLTNNTSLALAFERIADGRVLLFPADAQQGSWLSWQGLRWVVNGRVVTVNDLFEHMVFYKAGHHCSHNATAKGNGLERMSRHDDLVTFIPVDRAIALNRHPKGAWAMPAVPLYRRLLEQCQGRVARTDLGWAGPPVGETEAAFIELATAAEWAGWATRQRATKHVRIDNLYLEYVLV